MTQAIENTTHSRSKPRRRFITAPEPGPFVTSAAARQAHLVRPGRQGARALGRCLAVSPELQHAVYRLLDGSFQPRVTKRRNPKQLELFSRAARERAIPVVASGV